MILMLLHEAQIIEKICLGKKKAFQGLITSSRLPICRDSHLFFILKTTARASAAAVKPLAPSH